MSKRTDELEDRVMRELAKTPATQEQADALAALRELAREARRAEALTFAIEAGAVSSK